MIKLPVFKKRIDHKCLCNKFVSVQMPEILFPSLNGDKNCKISLGILMEMLTNS